ncbi:MAG TPA: hypothetical protein VIN61_08275 [Gammaproteobacteria bacterium]
MLVLLVACGATAQAAKRGELIDPVGLWRCIVYGHPTHGDERVLLRLSADGGTELAGPGSERNRAWVPLSSWNVERHTLTFQDFRTGREFVSDLRRSTLGGRWRTSFLFGGWWCTSMQDQAELVTDARAAELARLMPPLIPERLATPVYPLAAIRAGKEGRAVSCFFVDADGVIIEPEILELTDEVFREPTLRALASSRYRGWSDDSMVRPGCRSFLYRLDAAN